MAISPFAWVATVLLVASVASEDVAQCGRHRTGRIIGGWNAGANEYPMVAGLWVPRFDMVVCAATIVSVHHVVTAAHCVRNPANPTTSEMKVYVGANDYRNRKRLTE